MIFLERQYIGLNREEKHNFLLGTESQLKISQR